MRLPSIDRFIFAMAAFCVGHGVARWDRLDGLDVMMMALMALYVVWSICLEPRPGEEDA